MKILQPYCSKIILLLLPTFIVLNVQAQLGYNFTTANATYVANSGTSIINASVNDGISSARDIGFTFTFGCNTYTRFIASSNGFIGLGNTLGNSLSQNDLATTAQGPLIAPLWDDLATSSTGNVNFKLSGTAGSRILTVEWLNMRWTSANNNIVVSFQVKLYEGTNVIEYWYRAGANNPTNPGASIGFTNATAGDYYSLNGAGTAPAANYGAATNNINARPANNQVYRFTPAQVYVSSTAIQNTTTAISKCEIAPQEEIIGVQVITRGCVNPLSLTQLQFNMTGSTIAGNNTNDVSRIRIYYTGSSAAFATTNELVAGGLTPATGTISANGSQALANGENYFWIAYELNAASATPNNLLDARCTQLTIGSTARIPTNTAPTGSRLIANCAISPAGAKSNMAFWIKANAGTSSTTNGATINRWNDQSGMNRNATTTVTATSPVYYDNNSNNTNFNPVVNFDAAAQDTLLADFMDIAAGGILATGNNAYTVYTVIKPNAGNLSTPGKYLFSGSYNTTGNTFNSFDVRSNYALNDSWCLNDLIVANQWTPNYPSLATYDFNSSQRELFVAGASAGTKAGTNRNSPNQNCALGCQRSVSPMKEFYDGGIAEIVTYVNTSHDEATRNKIESYLAIKYGVTLAHNYLSSIGTTIWNRAVNTAYNSNIIGMGRDDYSALSQKQSKSTSVQPDLLTAYIGTTKQVNQANNNGSFAGGDRSFFMIANNNTPFLYTTTPTEVPSGICCRLQREWLVQKTNFTNTEVKLEFDFNVVTPGYSPLNLADLRLLVDADGNFSNATILGPTNATFVVTGSVVTVTLNASYFDSRPYFTLASVSTSTPLPVKFVKLNAGCQGNAAHINWVAENELHTDHYTVERSADGRTFTALAAIKSNTGAALQQSYNWTDATPLPGTSYYRLKTTDQSGATAYSAMMTFVDCGTEAIRLFNNTPGGGQELLLQFSRNAEVEIGLFDVSGRRYAVPGLTGRQQLAAGTYRLPVSSNGLGKGIYILSVTINGNKKIFRITQ